MDTANREKAIDLNIAELVEELSSLYEEAIDSFNNIELSVDGLEDIEPLKE